MDRGGDKSPPPEFGAGGGANANCPPRFCHIGTKMSVLWPSKYAKIRFRPGLCRGPRWGSSRRSPRPLSRLERGHPSPYPTPLGTDPPSALAMRPPEVQPDLRLWLKRPWGFIVGTLFWLSSVKVDNKVDCYHHHHHYLLTYFAHNT